MMNGGGLKSMIKVAAIVSLSSCYAGIFEGTGLLKPIQGKIEALSRKNHSVWCDLCGGGGCFHDCL